MAVYNGKCKDLISLSRTNISQETFDFVAEVGCISMKGYIDEGPDKVLTRQFKIWFDRCPDLLDEFETIFTDEFRGIYQRRINRDETIRFIFESHLQFFLDVMADSFGYYYVCPLFLRAFINRLKKEDKSEYYYPLIKFANYYFEEIYNSMHLAGMYSF